MCTIINHCFVYFNVNFNSNNKIEITSGKVFIESVAISNVALNITTSGSGIYRNVKLITYSN